MQRVAENHVTLKGKDNNEGQEQSNDCCVSKPWKKLIFKIIHSFGFDHMTSS